MHAIFPLIFATLCGFFSFGEEPLRTWTHVDGRKLEARFIEFTGDKIVICDKDKRSLKLPPSIFSKADQKYINSLLHPPEFLSRKQWTDASGKSFEAKFIACDGRFLRLEKDKGELSISLNKLDRDSLKYALANQHFDLKTEKRFVEKVCLHNEFGAGDGRSSPRGYVLKWNKNPKLSLQSLNFKELSFPVATDLVNLGKYSFAPTINEINKVLQGTGVQIELIPPDQKMADIKVYFASSDKDFRYILRINGIANTQHVRSLGALFNYRERNGEITKAIIIFRDRHFSRGIVLQEIAQVLGPTNDSSLIENSVFNGDSGTLPTELSSIDRGILRFIYNHCKSGESVTRFRKLFDEHWILHPR